LSTLSTPDAPPADARQFNAFKHQQQLRRGDLRTVTGSPWQLEATPFEPLVPDPQSRPIERQDLQTVATPVPKHKPSSRQRIFDKPLTNRRLQSVERTPHVERLSTH